MEENYSEFTAISLQFHSQLWTFVSSWAFSRNILLFNKSFVKKYSQTIFSSLFHSTVVSKVEE